MVFSLSAAAASGAFLELQLDFGDVLDLVHQLCIGVGRRVMFTESRIEVMIEHIIIHQRVLDVLQTFPGFIRRDVLDAVPGIQDETVVTLTFDTREHLLAWMDSPERAQFVNEIDGLVQGALTTSVIGGFAGWFPESDSPQGNPRWKQAVVVMIGLYPTVLFTSWLGNAIWADWNIFLAVLIGNAIGVTILTWLLMPPLTRYFADWLARR